MAKIAAIIRPGGEGGATAASLLLDLSLDKLSESFIAFAARARSTPLTRIAG
jgi:hypothetical protein